MSVVRRITEGLGARSSLAYPSDKLKSVFTGGSSTFAGKSVSVETGLTLGPVYSAAALVAGAVGGVPLKVYDGNRDEARSSRQWALLHDEPNDEMAADELWELVAHHLLLWGNSFLVKERDGFGVVRALWPIAPNRVTVGKEPRDGRLYRYFLVDGVPERHYDTDILHIRGLSDDGFVGYSVIQQARQQLGNMLAQDEFQGRFWSNGTFQGLALVHKDQLSDGAQERLAKQVRGKRGVAEANGVWVFEEDMQVQQLGMPLRDAEFVAQSKMSRLAIAELFGLVPPHRWGADGDSMTYANAEMAGTEFVRWTGRKWWTRIEKSLQRDKGLFPGDGLTVEFVPDDLMRGSTQERFEAYKLAIDAGIMTRNEARKRENLPPVDGGDEIVVAAPPVV